MMLALHATHPPTAADDRLAPRWHRFPMRAGFDALRRNSRFAEVPVAGRVLWVLIFAAAARPHYDGRLPFCDARQVALACGAPVAVVRQHLGALLAMGALRGVAGGLVPEAQEWPS